MPLDDEDEEDQKDRILIEKLKEQGVKIPYLTLLIKYILESSNKSASEHKHLNYKFQASPPRNRPSEQSPRRNRQKSG